jgi:hypothetical protein
LGAGRDFIKVKTPEKLSCVRVLVRAVSVAQKLNVIQKRLQKQGCLFQTRDYKSKAHNYKKHLGSTPDEGSVCKLKTTHDRRTAPSLKSFVSVMK